MREIGTLDVCNCGQDIRLIIVANGKEFWQLKDGYEVYKDNHWHTPASGTVAQGEGEREGPERENFTCHDCGALCERDVPKDRKVSSIFSAFCPEHADDRRAAVIHRLFPTIGGPGTGPYTPSPDPKRAA